ncbi:hypothetical protein [Leptospira biflexa]|uniref:hypothetical protein n=1 Tax=Leptospira biflexa TaxID=172 RepID=UPI001082F7E9|nr:hypothetical protein [Leptospira biflexa]TGM34027.1 hypothetical protein EHQ89_12495 [Leptospira biflexa]TGM40314.1 hypothetical protein EHQ80_03840 [Leptospira biflexa]
MRNSFYVIIFLFFLIGCEKDTSPLKGSEIGSSNLDYKKIESKVSISDGSIFWNASNEFESLESFNTLKMLQDFDYFIGKRADPFISIDGIDNNLISQKLFNESIVWFRFGYKKGILTYRVQTYSWFDTAGSNSDGIIKNVKCSHYTETFIKCKFYFDTSNPENGMPPMSWVIVTIKDRALVNVEDDLGASFLGYIDTDKKFPERYLSNLKKALKVAVKDPEIGLKDEQLRGFTIEELDLLTDGLASQVKAGK